MDNTRSRITATTSGREVNTSSRGFLSSGIQTNEGEKQKQTQKQDGFQFGTTTSFIYIWKKLRIFVYFTLTIFGKHKKGYCKRGENIETEKKLL